MLQITKQGNSIVVKGLDHALYPYSGTLEIPCNSVITVVDESDIVTFRSASNYDVLFSGLVTQITINGETVTKENVGDKFGALSNVNSDGLTPEQEEKLNNSVQIADYNADKATQTTIDEAQNDEINKLKGDIVGKQDIIQDLNAIREGADLGKTALQEETDPVWTAEKGNYYTKSEVNTSLESKANKTEIPTVPTNVSAFTNDAGYLTEHQPLKTINGETIVGSGDIVISGGGEETDPIWNAEKVNYYTKSEVNTSLESKADKSEIPSLNGYATEQWVEGKGYLTEHQDISGKLDKTEAASTYQPKGNYATKDEIPSLEGYATEEWVNSKGYLTEHQDISGKQDVITDLSDIRDGAALGKTALQSFTETDPVWTAEKGNYYTKDEANGKFLTEHQDISGKLDKTEAAETYQQKGNYATKDEIPSLEGYAKTADVNAELEKKQDVITDLDVIRDGAAKGATAIQEHQDISGKQDVITDLSDIRDGAALGKTALQSFTETDPTVPAHVKAITEEDIAKWNQGGGGEPDEYIKNAVTSEDGKTLTLSKKDGSEVVFSQNLNGYATEQWVGQQGYLTEHQSLKTINGETIVGNGDITISGGEQISDVLILPKNVEFTYKDGNKYLVRIKNISYNSKGGLDYTINIKKNGVTSMNNRKIGRIGKVGGDGWESMMFDYSAYGYKIEDSPTIPYYVYIFSDDDNPIEENAMYFDLGNPLVSGTEIKTINGESILGSGNIEISGGEETDPIWTAEKVNYYTKAEVDEMIGNINNALATLING